MSLLVTAGQREDSPQFQPVLEKIAVPVIGPGHPRESTTEDRVDLRDTPDSPGELD